MLRWLADRIGTNAARRADKTLAGARKIRRNQTRLSLHALEDRRMLSAAPVPYPAPYLALVHPLAAANTVDLTDAYPVGAVLPTEVLSGAGVKFRLAFTVTNQGTASTTGGAMTTMAINIYVRPDSAVDSSQDLLVTTLTNQSIADLAPGKTKNFNPLITIPVSVPTGDYHLVVLVNATDTVAETSTANDSAVTTQSLHIVGGVVDLEAGNVTTTLPASVVAGTNKPGTVSVTVFNGGDVAVPTGQNITIAVYARPVGAADNSTDILLTTKSVAIGALAPAASKLESVKIATFPAALATGAYNIVAVVDSLVVVPGESSVNSTGVSLQTIAVTAPGAPQPVDVALTSGSTTLASTVAGGATGTATIGFANLADSAATGTYRIDIYALPSGDGSQTPVLVGTTGSKTLSLAADAAATPVVINLTMPTPGADTTYELIAQLVPSAGDANPGNTILDIAPITVTA